MIADDTAIGVIELAVPETPKLTAAEAFEQLENELHNRGEYLVADEQIAERLRELIENNAYLCRAPERAPISHNRRKSVIVEAASKTAEQGGHTCPSISWEL